MDLVDFSFLRSDIILPYSEAFNDHIANPRHVGELENPDTVAEQTNPVCGDRLRLSLRVQENVIKEARFLAYGCAPTLACGSALVSVVEGMKVEQASQLTRDDIIRSVGGLPARKRHAAALAIETLRASIEAFLDESES